MGLLVVWLVWVLDGQSSTASLKTGLTQLELGTIVASSYISAAKGAVEREREQLIQERDAFHQFATEIESIPVSTAGREGLPPVGVGQANVAKGELGRVRAAYRRTVMELDHFDRVYDEQLSENMSSELSDDVATAVIHGNQFSLPVKQAAMQQATKASIRRENLLETINAERESLEYARDQLSEITAVLEDEPAMSEFTLTELFEYERRIKQCQRQCKRLLRTRQHDIHSEGRIPSKFDKLFVQTYLYDDLDTVFPVLNAGSRRYSRLEARQRTVHDEITYR